MHYEIDRVRRITPYINIVLYRATCPYLHIHIGTVYVHSSECAWNTRKTVCVAASARVRAVRRGRSLLSVSFRLIFPFSPDMTSNNSNSKPSNSVVGGGGGKHVRSHSLKSFPAVAVAVIDNRKPPDNGGGSVASAGSDPQTTTKITSTWKQVFIFDSPITI